LFSCFSCLNKNMAITSSDIHANLSTEKMFADGCFLSYCCCGGTVIGAVGEPLFGSEAKNVCVHQRSMCTDVSDPVFCYGTAVEFCMTSQCSFKPLDGSPTCVCFNKKLKGEVGAGWKPKLFDYTIKFDETWWLYYICCLGFGFSGLQANGRPLCAVENKQLCLQSSLKLSPICDGGTWCSGVGTQLCCWSQFQYPPIANNPKIGCFGWRMNKESGAGGKPCEYGGGGKPAQNVMGAST
jgi:hypothetical protein